MSSAVDDAMASLRQNEPKPKPTKRTAKPKLDTVEPTEQPSTLAVAFDAIPDELRQLPQWVVWRRQRRGGKWTKPPHQVDGTMASSTDPETWSTFDEVREASESGKFAGIGFVLTAGDSYTGIDLDHCFSKDGHLDDQARRIVDLLDSYTERSPSGDGIRIFVRAELPMDGGKHDGVEAYDNKRYLTVTGQVFEGRDQLEDRQPELDGFVETYLRPAAANVSSPLVVSQRAEGGDVGPGDDDRAVLDRVRAKHGERFGRTCDGDNSEFASASDADWFVCCCLAEHTRDGDQIDRIFRTLPRVDRGKWDTARGNSTYGRRTIDRALKKVASEVKAQVTGDDTTRSSARNRLLELVDSSFTIGRGDDGRTFIVDNEGPNVTLWSHTAKARLATRHWRETGEAVGSNPLDEAWRVVEGMAQDVEKASLPTRVARQGDGVVIDMSDAAGRVIVVSPEGWEIVARSPVTFDRPEVSMRLPEPVQNGDPTAVFSLLRVDPAHQHLFLAWMVATYFPDIPHPIVQLRGEQGSAKSATARLMSRLIDPCTADTQRPPRDDREWTHTCIARYLIPIDNVSDIPPWWSDSLCRAVTGDGTLTRTLYTDRGTTAHKFRRCIILNGIGVGSTLRGDLGERLVAFDLERPERYLTDQEANETLDGMAPRVLGGLLDQVVAILRKLPGVEIPRDVRMADFGRLLAAYDAVNKTDTLDVYRAGVAEVFDEALASDPVALAVIQFMETRTLWKGELGELLNELSTFRPSHGFWPAKSSSLSNAIARASTGLRRVGIIWTKPAKSTGGRRIAHLERIPQQTELELGGTDAKA